MRLQLGQEVPLHLSDQLHVLLTWEQALCGTAVQSSLTFSFQILTITGLHKLLQF